MIDVVAQAVLCLRMFSFSRQPARIHPEGVDGRKARGKRGSAPPRDNEPPLEGALVRARDLEIGKPRDSAGSKGLRAGRFLAPLPGRLLTLHSGGGALARLPPATILPRLRRVKAKVLSINCLAAVLHARGHAPSA